MQTKLMRQMLLIQALLVITHFADIESVATLYQVDNGPALSRKEVGDAQCDNCRKFMGKFYESIEVHLKDIKPEIIKIVEKTCQKAQTDAGMCDDAIDDFPDFMIEQLRLLLNPYGFCPAADYCKNNGSTHQMTEADDCAQCQTFFAGVRQKLIKNNQIDVAVSEQFRKACDSFCTLSLFCYEMVKEFFPVMLEKVATLGPDDLTGCTELGYCKTSAKKQQQSKGLITKLLQNPSLTVAQPNGPTCSNCQEFMGQVYILLEGSVKQLTPLIASTASQVCNLAGNLTSMCKDALKDFPDVLVPDLITLVNPYFFCPETKYCTASEIKVGSSNNITDTDKCTQCKSFFTDVYQRIGKDINIDVAISKQLEKTCAGFCSLAFFCNKAVESFVPGMIQSSPPNFPQATDTCTSLKYCTNVDSFFVQ